MNLRQLFGKDREAAKPMITADPMDALLDRATAEWKVEGGNAYMDTRVFARIQEIRDAERRRRVWTFALAGGLASLAAVVVAVSLRSPVAASRVALLDEEPAMLSDMAMMEDDELIAAMAAVAEGERG